MNQIVCYVRQTVVKNKGKKIIVDTKKTFNKINRENMKNKEKNIVKHHNGNATLILLNIRISFTMLLIIQLV